VSSLGPDGRLKFLSAIPNSWFIAATGDFNGDTLGDILWRNRTTNDTVIWFMNGGTITSSADLGPVSVSQWTLVQ
jgi:predicted ATP-grasp superfamily ATP-dependent carboligase